ncbi:MAG: MFS transporter [Clostridia bacterium]|nr:MFS transporter [Clostridia bacterium]
MKKERNFDSKFTVSNIALLATHGIYIVSDIFVSTFLISYIYSISSNYVFDIGLYYLFTYIACASLMIIFSIWVDRTNRVGFYRVATIARSLFIFLIIFWGNKLAQNVILAGLVHGISLALYWSSFNLLKTETIRKNTVGRFSSYQFIVSKVVTIVVPIVFGKIIDADSFKTSAIINLVLAVIGIVVSLFIRCDKPDGSAFEYKRFIDFINNSGKYKPFIKKCLHMGYCYGIGKVTIPLNTILIMLAFGSNFSLGIQSGLVAAVGIFTVVFVRKLTKQGKRNWLFLIGIIFPLISAVLLVFKLDIVTVTIFNFTYNIFFVVYDLIYDTHRGYIVKKLNMREFIAEYQCTIEAGMDIVRIFVFGIMTLVGYIVGKYYPNSMNLAIEVLIILSMSAFVVINVMLAGYEKEFEKLDLHQ